MAQPADHTLRLFRELRGDIKNLGKQVADLDGKVDRGFEELRESMKDLARVVAGEMVTRRHTDAKVDERLIALERRVSLLEERR